MSEEQVICVASFHTTHRLRNRTSGIDLGLPVGKKVETRRAQKRRFQVRFAGLQKALGSVDESEQRVPCRAQNERAMRLDL